jgi:flagellar basal body-associated protein FliL
MEKIKLSLPAGQAGKKPLLYLGIVLIVVPFFCIGLLYYFYFVSKSRPATEEISEALKREKIIKQQLEELDKLRGEVKPLTEQEIQKQLEELNKLR